MKKSEVIEFLRKSGIWVEDGKIAKASLFQAKEMLVAKYSTTAGACDISHEIKSKASKAEIEKAFYEKKAIRSDDF